MLVTYESVATADHHGFHLADPFDVSFDPEPRRPFVLDWDSMAPSNGRLKAKRCIRRCAVVINDDAAA